MSHFRRRPSGVVALSAIVSVAALLAALGVWSSPQDRNVKVTRPGELPRTAAAKRAGYRGQQIHSGPAPETLVVLALSGGGKRAAALGFGTMLALQAVELRTGEAQSATLLDAVDIVSAVSGGSVPAAYLALVGPRGLSSIGPKFLEGRMPFWMDAAARIPKLLITADERIDILIDWLDATLFDYATYEDLWDSSTDMWRRPFVILNATDTGTGSVFPFHQGRFDLLCSDLTQVPMSVAVAASAAFPVAFTPLTLTNYSNQECNPYVNAENNGLHIRQRPETSLAGAYANPDRLFRSRNAYGYTEVRNGAIARPFVHLLDGGIADNLGLTEPIWMLVDLELDTNPAWERVLGKLQRVVFIVVNAEPRPGGDDSVSRTGPGVFGMFMRTAEGSMRSATAAILRETRDTLDLMERTVSSTTLVQITLKLIRDEECRRQLMAIPTRWDIRSDEVQALVRIAEPLMWKDPQFRRLVMGNRKLFRTDAWSKERALEREREVCRELLGE